MSYVYSIYRRLGNHRRRIAGLSVMTMLFESTIPVLQVSLLAVFVSSLVEGREMIYIIVPLFGYLTSLFAMYLVPYIREMLSFHAKKMISHRFERELLEKVSTTSLQDRMTVKFNEELDRTKYMLASGQLYSFVEIGLNVMVSFITLLLLTFNLLSVHWSIPFLLIATFMGIFPFVNRVKAKYWGVIFSQSKKSMTAGAIEQSMHSKTSFMDMLVLGHFQWLKNKWFYHYEKVMKTKRKELIKVKSYMTFFDLVIALLPFLLALIFLLKNTIRTYEVVLFFMTLRALVPTASSLFQNISSFYEKYVQYQESERFLSHPYSESYHFTEEKEANRDITFSEVSFTYPEANAAALKNVNVTIPEGKVTCIVGDNGSGKTTFIHLLLGLYSSTSGNIEFNDKGSKVPQSTVLFQKFFRLKSTIRDNITIGYEGEIIDLDIKRSITQARADFIFKLGLDCSLDREFGGRDLSGGEWQKLALARTFLRKKGMIVLDEPTASFDPVTEIEVYKNVIDIFKNRTVVLVSHRLTASVLADQIVVLKNGEIIETGHHNELMEKQGEYYEMFNAQAKAYLKHYYQKENNDV